ncbi:copper resistance CopC family protein [Paenibacillus paeoniae]|uniref:CopC domain-containing protein n=1 Tax=Paenibacillus paeoniae TaxID=2292705 RepID=A0A371PIL1_9BACL|nr:copper resistance protein CopC [Paenibacillus paeoniae]REK75974.1 hypothetical protein DX130_02560 [Paenibacillus paeoniae]
MKRALLILMALIWLLPSAALAHSTLHTALPGVDATVDVSPERIEMKFDTKIEKLSTFKLFNEAGEQLDTGKAEVSGDTMTGTVPAALDNGKYTVKWTIIGADSHAVEGEYAFTVDTPVLATPSPTPSEEPSNEPSEQPSEQPSATPTSTPTPTDNDSHDDFAEVLASPPVLVMIAIVIIAVVIFVVLMRKKSS